LPEIRIDPQSPVEIAIKAETPAVFRFTAQFRAPGQDYVDFASARDSSHVSQSAYSIQLNAPIRPYTDLRVYFLVDGPTNHPYRIRVQCSQGGSPVGAPIICEGTIGKDGKIVFATAEGTFV
jgi:hypothetical protein